MPPKADSIKPLAKTVETSGTGAIKLVMSNLTEEWPGPPLLASTYHPKISFAPTGTTTGPVPNTNPYVPGPWANWWVVPFRYQPTASLASRELANHVNDNVGVSGWGTIGIVNRVLPPTAVLFPLTTNSPKPFVSTPPEDAGAVPIPEKTPLPAKVQRDPSRFTCCLLYWPEVSEPAGGGGVSYHPLKSAKAPHAVPKASDPANNNLFIYSKISQSN